MTSAHTSTSSSPSPAVPPWARTTQVLSFNGLNRARLMTQSATSLTNSRRSPTTERKFPSRRRDLIRLSPLRRVKAVAREHRRRDGFQPSLQILGVIGDYRRRILLGRWPLPAHGHILTKHRAKASRIAIRCLEQYVGQ